MIVRAEEQHDIKAIYALNKESFSTESEAELVDSLRNEGVPIISLVVEENDVLVGHIVFTPVTIRGENPGKNLCGLGPMSVIPSWRGKGVGKLLVEEGMKVCSMKDYDAVVVLGHEDYYPRFGFVPSVAYGIVSSYDVPDEIFMIKELRKGGLKGVQGTVSYHDFFREV